MQAEAQLRAASGAAAHSEGARRLLHGGGEIGPDPAWGGSLPKKVGYVHGTSEKACWLMQSPPGQTTLASCKQHIEKWHCSTYSAWAL